MAAETETLIHPEDLQTELGIKKDAYYEDVKFLKSLGYDIQTRKDDDNRVMLEPESADLIRELRQHVTTTGKREGFRAGELAAVDVSQPVAVETGLPGAQNGYAESLIQRAQELTAQRLMTADLVVAELAEQMGYDDLTPDQQAQVAKVQDVTYPKANPAAIALQLLQQFRASRYQSGVPQAQAG
jgi:hypothetical protein